VRIAILGGTFDPIHNGHLRAAQTVADAFAIDEVHFIPAFTPPHKSRTGITSAFHRFAMVALAIAGSRRFHLSTIEVDRLELRYSVDTLELMHERYPGSAFLFVTGTDLYAEIEDWKSCQRLFDLTSFAVVNRPGFPMRNDIRRVEVVETQPAHALSETPRVYYLPHLDEDISSTVLRERLHEGQDAAAWIPSEVQTYIATNRLYS
jgi:nicotinate-nucleotide adenylyltransferase